MRPIATVVTVVLAAASLGALAGCGGSDDAATSAATNTQAASNTGCEQVAAPAPKGPQHLKKPTLQLDPGKRWTATVTTNCGAFTIALAVDRQPKTTASFVSLVRKGFYDGLTFHRIAPDFVIQGGDPLGNGSGGPGYKVVESPPRRFDYAYGAVAMAKTATDPNGTSGSQFFVVVGEDANLPPQYAVVGKVTAGFDVITRIGNLEVSTSDPQGGPPVDPVVIDSIKVAPKPAS